MSCAPLHQGSSWIYRRMASTIMRQMSSSSAVNDCYRDFSPTDHHDGSIDGMFPVPWFVAALYLAAYALAGMAVGAITGWLVSLRIKGGRQRLLKDALLGSFGYLAGFFVRIFMPWPQNTVVTRLEGGGSVATTMSRYQHPERLAIVIAVLFPLLYELSRRTMRKASSLT